MSKIILLIFLIVQLVGCKPYSGKVWNIYKDEQVSRVIVTSLDVRENLISIKGANFNGVTSVVLRGVGLNDSLNIVSLSQDEIQVRAPRGISLLLGAVLDLVISKASASATFPVTFDLQDGAILARHLSSMGATAGQVLKYNGSQWVPSSLSSSQNYLGVYDAFNNNPDITSLGQFSKGDFFIVTVGGELNGVEYFPGDWVIFNGLGWDKVDNSSNVVSSFQGRRGVVTLLPSDYTSLKNMGKIPGSSLNDLFDVDTSGLVVNKILKYNGVKWAVADDLSGGGSGSVGTSELQDSAVTYSKLALSDGDIPLVKVNGLSTLLAGKESTIAAGTTTQYYRGDKTWQTLDTAVIAEGTNLYFTNARALGVPLTGFTTATGAVVATDSILAAMGKLQGQINTKADSGIVVDWSTSGLQTIDPSRLNLGVGSASKALVTNASGFIVAGGATSTELGYLSGVTSSIQTQLNAKQGTLGTGSVTSTHIQDGTITDADLAGSISQSKISNLTTDLGSKQNTSSLASDVGSIVLTGLSTVTNAVITASDSILVAFGKLQKQITDLNSTTLKTTGGTLTVGTIDGVPTPTTATQVANKAYVDGLSSDPQAPSAYSPTCPLNYISVPAIPYYPGPSFCVMKYEAKTGSASVAATTASAGAPQATISRNNARAACRLIGPGYDLISNAQWQTIARNIADQASNWSTGTAYSGELNRGHSDGSPNNALAASTDTDGCNGTGQSCSNTVWDSQRRTHTLSNGEVIWDIAGNVWEWVSDNNSSSQGTNEYISTMNTGDNRQKRFGNDRFCASPSSSPNCGMGYGWFNYTAGAVLRGGDWSNVVVTGVFASRLLTAPTGASTIFGFRCVFVP